MNTAPTEFDWSVRASVYEGFATTGQPPAIGLIAAEIGGTEHQVRSSLERLQAAHEIALRPDGRIWMANPFSATPTAYPVETPDMTCWANCAWDALGVPAILESDGWTRSRCAESGISLEFGIEDGRVRGDEGVVHLLTPLRDAWADIGFT